LTAERRSASPKRAHPWWPRHAHPGLPRALSHLGRGVQPMAWTGLSAQPAPLAGRAGQSACPADARTGDGPRGRWSLSPIGHWTVGAPGRLHPGAGRLKRRHNHADDGPARRGEARTSTIGAVTGPAVTARVLDSRIPYDGHPNAAAVRRPTRAPGAGGHFHTADEPPRPRTSRRLGKSPAA
jgi:hypothetical protein